MRTTGLNFIRAQIVLITPHINAEFEKLQYCEEEQEFREILHEIRGDIIQYTRYENYVPRI